MKTLEKIKVRNEEVRLSVEDDDTQTSFLISLNQFLDLGLRENQPVDDDMFEKLKQEHTYYFAYKKAIRKLSSSDQSEKEIRDLLRDVEALKPSQLESIVSALIDYGYIDDESIVTTCFENDHLRGIGKRKTAYNLSKRGISRQLIDSLSHLADQHDQHDSCLNKAKALLRNTRGLSQRAAIAKVREHLHSDGFESDVIDQVMSEIDYEKDESEDINAAFNKAYARYKKSAKGSKALRQKIYQYLYNKGFESYNITEVMNRLENSDED